MAFIFGPCFYSKRYFVLLTSFICSYRLYDRKGQPVDWTISGMNARTKAKKDRSPAAHLIMFYLEFLSKAGREGGVLNNRIHGMIWGEEQQHSFFYNLWEYGKGEKRNDIANLLLMIDSKALDPRQAYFEYLDHKFPLGSKGAPDNSKEMFRYLLRNETACYLVWTLVVSEIVHGKHKNFNDLLPGCSKCIMVSDGETNSERLFFGVHVPSLRTLACLRHAHKYGYAHRLKVSDFFDKDGNKINPNDPKSKTYESSHLCATKNRPSAKPSYWPENEPFEVCILHVKYDTRKINVHDRRNCIGTVRLRDNGGYILMCDCPCAIDPELGTICLEVRDEPSVANRIRRRRVWSTTPSNKSHGGMRLSHVPH